MELACSQEEVAKSPLYNIGQPHSHADRSSTDL